MRKLLEKLFKPKVRWYFNWEWKVWEIIDCESNNGIFYGYIKYTTFDYAEGDDSAKQKQ